MQEQQLSVEPQDIQKEPTPQRTYTKPQLQQYDQWKAITGLSLSV